MFVFCVYVCVCVYACVHVSTRIDMYAHVCTLAFLNVHGVQIQKSTLNPSGYMMRTCICALNDSHVHMCDMTRPIVLTNMHT